MEASPADNSYIEEGRKYIPEGSRKGLNSADLDSLLNIALTADADEWEGGFGSSTKKLGVGETTFVRSGAHEYVKVTKNTDGTFDTEHGTYEEE